MKKIFALILTFCCLLTACGAPAAPTQEQSLEQAKDALLEEYYKVLTCIQVRTEALLWAYDYAIAFSEDVSWEHLQKANAAASAARQTIEVQQAPVLDLSEEHYMILQDAGIDFLAVLDGFSSFETGHTADLTSAMWLEDLFVESIFFSAYLQQLPDILKAKRDMTVAMAEYECATVNDLLLQLGREQLWDTYLQSLPTLHALRGDWRNDSSELSLHAAALLDRYEKQMVVDGQCIGLTQYIYTLVDDALATGDHSALQKALHPYADLPAVFPAPVWLDAQIGSYYTVADALTQAPRTIQPGEDLPPPSARIIECAPVSRQDVEYYKYILDAYSIAYTEDEDDGIYRLQAGGQDGTLCIEWSEPSTQLFLYEPIACLLSEYLIIS